MLHNLGGERFEDVTFSGGFGHLQKGHGIAFGDLDVNSDTFSFCRASVSLILKSITIAE